jgi:hypothetical protein
MHSEVNQPLNPKSHHANSALSLANDGKLTNDAFPLSANIVRVLESDIQSIINNIDPSIPSNEMDLLFSRLMDEKRYEQKTGILYLTLRLATSSEIASKRLSEILSSSKSRDDWGVEFLNYTIHLFDQDYFNAQYQLSPLDFIFLNRDLKAVPDMSITDAICFLADAHDDASEALVSISDLHPKLSSELLGRTLKNLLKGDSIDPQIDLNEAALLCKLLASENDISDQVISALKATLEESCVENSAFIGKCVQAFQQYLEEESITESTNQSSYKTDPSNQKEKLLGAISQIVSRWAFNGHTIPEKAASALCLAAEVDILKIDVKDKILDLSDSEFHDLVDSLMPMLAQDINGALSDALVSIGALKSMFDRADNSRSEQLEQLQLSLLPHLFKNCQSNLAILCAQFVNAFEYCSPEQATIRQNIFLRSLKNSENNESINSIIADLTIMQLSARVSDLNRRLEPNRAKNTPIDDINSRIIRLLSFACEIPKITGPSPFDEPKSRKALRNLFESAFERKKHFCFDRFSRSKKPNFGPMAQCISELLQNRDTVELLQDLRTSTLFSYIDVQTASGSTVHFIFPLPEDSVTVSMLAGLVLRETLIADRNRTIGLVPSRQMLEVLKVYQEKSPLVPDGINEHFFLCSDFYDHMHQNGGFKSILESNFANINVSNPLAIANSIEKFYENIQLDSELETDEPILDAAIAFFGDNGALWPALRNTQFASMSGKLVASVETLDFVESNGLGTASRFGFTAFASGKWIMDAKRAVIVIDSDSVPKFLHTLLTSKDEQKNQGWLSKLAESNELIFVLSPKLVSKLKFTHK